MQTVHVFCIFAYVGKKVVYWSWKPILDMRISFGQNHPISVLNMIWSWLTHCMLILIHKSCPATTPCWFPLSLHAVGDRRSVAVLNGTSRVACIPLMHTCIVYYCICHNWLDKGKSVRAIGISGQPLNSFTVKLVLRKIKLLKSFFSY